MTIEELVKKPHATLLDIREEEELLVEGNVPNAIHIPMGEISTRLEEVKSFSKPLIIFCRSGRRADNILTYLKEQGVEEVYNGMGFNDVNTILQS